MNTRIISADLRFSLPVFVAWGILAAVLLVFPEEQLTVPLLGIGTMLFTLFGVVIIRRLPFLGFCVVIVVALLTSWQVQGPSHVETHPWDVPISSIEPWWLGWADVLRNSFLTATSELPGYGGQLIPGLAIGDTSRVSEHLSNSMKVVSLTHITAVSGANCAIVTVGVMAFSALCGFGRKFRLCAATATLIAFVVLVTPQPSVLRAAVMAIVVMISLWSGRPGTGMPLLASATVVLLMWNPWWAIDFGFILSVSATAGLLLFSGPLTTSLSRWLPLWLSAAIAIPLSAQLMCQPFINLLSPQLPTYGVLANIIASFAAPIATVVGLIACLFTWWAPGLAVPLLWLSWLPSEWIGQTAVNIARFPQAQIPWFEGAFGSLIAAIFSLLVFLVLLSGRKFVRRLSFVLLAATIICWLVTTFLNSLTFSSSLPRHWNIATCDVGQGDALVLKSQEKVAVIDVGRTPEPLRKCLQQLGITHIDLLVLTHFDKDHVGGLDAVIGKVDSAIVGRPENSEDQELLTELRRSGAQLYRGVQGLTGSLGEAQWQVLWPDTHHPSMELGNPGSVTLIFAFPTFKALFLGDLGRDAQLALMDTVDLPSVQVVKVAHHGSADQSSTLYQKVQPIISIFSVGADNDYGHPRSETLTMLTDMGSLTPRTDQDGLILISTSSSGLSLWTER